MILTPEDASRQLQAIEESRSALRSTLRARRGHHHLWLWGGAWSFMAALVQFQGPAGARFFPWIAAAGMVASFLIGWRQNHQIRTPVDRRFIAVLAAALGFGLFWPTLLLTSRPTNEVIFAYIGLLAMQAYVIAGVWFDTYLTWVGLLVTALIIVGYFFLLPWFWLWIGFVVGGTLIGTGFYVRFLLR